MATKIIKDKIEKKEINSLKIERALLSEAYFQLKKTTKELEQKNRFLHMLGESNQALIRAADEKKLLAEICRIIVEIGGYRMAWIGFIEYDKEKSILPLAQAGFEDGYLASLKLTWANSERGKGPSGVAIRTKKPTVIKNIQTDSRMLPWRDDALKRGYKSVVSIPLLNEGRSLGILSIYSNEIDAFNDEEIGVLNEFAGDISIGITSFRAQAENKKFQEALLTSEIKYRSLFETAKDGIIIIDAETGVINEINYSLVELLGYGPDSFLRKKMWEVDVLSKVISSEKIFNEFKKNKYKRIENIEVKARDGRVVYLEFISNLYPVERSGVIQCNLRDNTARHEAEMRLKDNESHFRAIFENSPVAIVLVGLDTKFLRVNQAAVKLWGYSEKELQKITFREITAPNEVSRDEKNIMKMLKGELDVYEVDKTYIRKDKSVIYARASVSLLKNLENKPEFFLTIIEDMTDRYQWEAKINKSEAKYSALVEQSSDAVLVVQDKLIKFGNRTICNMSGYNLKELINMPILDLVLDKYKKNVADKFAQRLRGLSSASRYEFELLRKDGTPLFVEVNSSLIDFEGSVASMAIIRDITQAKKIDQMKSEFISIASHQLRSPLTGIKWFGQLLIDEKAGKLTPKQLDFIQQIYISNERMIHLVNDLLNVSRIETGRKFTIQKKTGDALSLINDVIKEHKINSPKKEIVIEPDKRCPGSIPFAFDYEKIYQVFSNLVSNAIKYSEPETKIIIGCKKSENEVEFFVKDFGYGIPENQKERVFSKFFRADNIVTKSTDGTGLGLYIAKSIVIAHGGNMWFESKQNEGTTFYFTLPLINEEDAEPAPSPEEVFAKV